MSKIIPFKAFIPKKGLEQKIASPPYDVVESEAARKLAEGNPHSLLHITKPEIDLPAQTNAEGPAVYEKAKQNLNSFLGARYLVQDKPSLYVYRINTGKHVQTGLVSLVSALEYDEGLIKKHELTKKDKEDDRTRLSLMLGAHMEPVLLVNPLNDSIKTLLVSETKSAPLFDVKDLDGNSHILWRVRHADEIVREFSKIPALYIADGHHRSATASRVREALRREDPRHTGTEPYNFFPAVTFPHDELCVYRYDWEGPGEKRPMAEMTIEEIMALADRGGIMPPKSTWFAPKLLSGLFVYAF